MRKVLLLLVGTAVLWLPAVSVAGDSSPNASKPAAKAEASDAENTVRNPASTCKSQRSGASFAASHHGRTFTEFYGTNRGKGRGAGANAFGKCVSTIARHRTESDDGDRAESHGKDSAERDGKRRANGKGRANPAMTCKAMQSNEAAHFRATYGTRPNAFGKCVSEHAKG